MPPAPPEMCTPAPPEMCTPPHSPVPASPLPSPPADEEELPEAMDVDEELLPVYPSLHRTRGGLRVHLPDGSMVAWSTFRQRPGEWADYTGILVELLELAGGNPAKKRRIDFNDGASTGARCCQVVAAGGRGHPALAGMTKQRKRTKAELHDEFYRDQRVPLEPIPRVGGRTRASVTLLCTHWGVVAQTTPDFPPRGPSGSPCPVARPAVEDLLLQPPPSPSSTSSSAAPRRRVPYAPLCD